MAILLMGMGVVLLVIAGIFRNNKLLEGAASAFNTPAMLAIGLGTVLLAIHIFVKRATSGAQPLPARDGTGRKASRVPPAAVEHHNDTLTSPKRPNTTEQENPIYRVKGSSTWNPAVFTQIEWRRFEAVCEALFAQAGFETKAQSHGADGGVDIWLHSKNAEGPVAVVQCKHWQGKPVGVKELREFFGVMASHGLQRGTYATTSNYTADAKAFAQANGINAMDGTALLNLIAKRTPDQQATLLAVAYEGEYWRPTCANCGIKLVERTPAKGGAPFWGCSNFPRCKTRIYKAMKA